MAQSACLAPNVSSVGGRWKNIGSPSRHIYSPGLPALSACLVCAHY